MLRFVIVLPAVVACAHPAPSTGDQQRPYVVSTSPKAGDKAVPVSVDRIVVEFNEPMMNRSWSWVTLDGGTYPETTGDPIYTSAVRVELPVKLAPGVDYAMSINSKRFVNFKDVAGNPAVPFELRFSTAGP